MAPDRAATMQSIANLLPRLDDPDPDIRFMQLNDLASILTQSSSESLRNDSHIAARVIDRIIKALTDSNGEVQNQALKCVGPLATRTPNDYFAPYTNKVTELISTASDISVPITALRILVASLPNTRTGTNERDVRDAYSAVSRVLVPRLVGYVPASNEKKPAELTAGLLQQQKDKSYSADAVDVVIELVRCYGTMLRGDELSVIGNTLMETISSPQANGVVKKRSLVGVGAIAPYYKQDQLFQLLQFIANTLQQTDVTTGHRRYLISAVGVLARSVPTVLGSHLDLLTPLVLDVLSQDALDQSREGSDDEMAGDTEIEELREATLVTVESLLASCPTEMQLYWEPTLQAALRYVKYDPNIVDNDDEEMSGTRDAQSDDGFTDDPIDEDDEYAELDDEDAFDDVEDVSWKVRRCAAKVLLTIIAGSPATEHETLISKVAPVLLLRLNNEREDSVRLEVIAAITSLAQKIALTAARQGEQANGFTNTAATSNKRKRQDSNVSIGDVDLRGLVHSRSSPPFVPPGPAVGSQASLASLVPKIIQGTVKLWKKASVALKQASIVMLKAVAQSRNGALADYLQQLEDPFADALKYSGGSGSTNASGSTATPASLQIETLSLIASITETNPSSVLLPFVIALIPSATSLVNDRNSRVAVETLATMEQFAKALTPPRLPSTNLDHAIHLEKLYTVTLGPVNDIKADLEVRHRAIQVFGVLVARTSGTKLLSIQARAKALGVLDDRLKNETTRLKSARAIGLVAESATMHDNVGSAWVQEVSIELANQLRKADRSLRASSLEALQYLALNPVTASQYATDTIQALQAQLLPVIRPDDLNLLTPALVIFAKIVPTNPSVLVDQAVVEVLCKLAQSHLEGPALKAYLLVVKVIGEHQQGPLLMSGLLAVGTNGNTHVLGRAIGTLMVHGVQNLGVSIDSFVSETNNKDESAACLALTVLGEIGLRMGANTPFKLDILAQRLSSSSSKVRLSAAVALGSASSSDIQKYLPAILQGISGTPEQQYLYLHSLKEILQHGDNAISSILPYTQDMWTRMFAIAATEDNQAVAFECIGRIVLLDPSKYLEALIQGMDSTEAAQRGIIVSAFRYTLSSSSSSYNIALARTIVPLLKKMLADPDLSNRRLAITTLTAAIQHKPEYVLVDLEQLMPVVIADAHIKKELIKTVKIGPFTHKEDSGIDLRKAAYTTLYTVIETPKAFPFLSFPAIFERIQEGVADEQDIRVLCSLMLARLADLESEETRRRLPRFAEQFKKVLEQKPKENAVKQEIEKITEANSSVIRTTIMLQSKFPGAANTAATDPDMAIWKSYTDYMQKEFAHMVKQIDSEA